MSSTSGWVLAIDTASGINVGLAHDGRPVDYYLGAVGGRFRFSTLFPYWDPVQGTLMGGAIDPVGQPRHDGQARRAEGLGKRSGVVLPLRSGVATAHHRQRRGLQQIQPALSKQQHGWVRGGLQQGGRVALIGQGDHGARRAHGGVGLQPGPGQLDLFIQ